MENSNIFDHSKPVRGLYGDVNVTVVGDIKVGSTVEARDKDGYYIMEFSGTVFAIHENSLTVTNSEGSRNTVSSGTHRLEGGTIEVLA